jgi:O-antigen ligase
MIAGAMMLPAIGVAAWLLIPQGSIQRISTIAEQLRGGSLNDRVNIWAQGWQAFASAPLFGSGAGSFVHAAGLAAVNSAHDTMLSIAVEGGLVAVFLGVLILVLLAREILRLRGALLIAMATSLAVWCVTSLTATIEANRTTWLLFAMIAVSGRLAQACPEWLEASLRSNRNGRRHPVAEGVSFRLAD